MKYFTNKQVKKIFWQLKANFFTSTYREDDESDALILNIGDYTLWFYLSNGNRHVYLRGVRIENPYKLFDQLLAEEVFHRASQGEDSYNTMVKLR